MGIEPSKSQSIDPEQLRLEIANMRKQWGYPAFSDGADIAYIGELNVSGKDGRWLHPNNGLENGLCTSVQTVNPIEATNFQQALQLWVAIQEGLTRPKAAPVDQPGMRPIINEIERGVFPADIGSTFVERVPNEPEWYFVKYPDGSVEKSVMIKIEQSGSRYHKSNHHAFLALLAVRNLESTSV